MEITLKQPIGKPNSENGIKGLNFLIPDPGIEKSINYNH